MQTVNEKQVSLFDAIQWVFGYYQGLHQGDSKPLFLPPHDPDTLHFVNWFLKETNYVSFNIDGTLKWVQPSFPDQFLLSSLISNFLQRYCVNKVALTQEKLKFLAKLPARRKRRPETLPPVPKGYIGYFVLREKGDEPQEARDNEIQTITSNEDESQIRKSQLGKKIRISDWSESEFAQSVRLLYNFYASHDCQLYREEEIFGIINLGQFTVSENKPSNVLRVFNKFLVANKFLTQVKENLYSIEVTKKLFPDQDKELENLFKKFKTLYYKKQLPSNLTVADFERHHAKPAAAWPNRAAISFIIDDSAQENSFVLD
jgi:hypothetical protein